MDGGNIMCRVVIKDVEKNVDFIIYNHLFSKDISYRFTAVQLKNELLQYNLEVSLDYIEDTIHSFIQAGLINQNFRCYSVCGR